MQAPGWLRAGDTVRIEIEGIGVLENPVIDEAGPTNERRRAAGAPHGGRDGRDGRLLRRAVGHGSPSVRASRRCSCRATAASATLLGLPDFGYLTQTEMAEVARRVCRTVPEVQVVVDGDTGYGNPLNTIRTVELYEEAGAAGIFLEDQVWPKKCGHMAGKQVVPREEWLAKLRAALDAATGSSSPPAPTPALPSSSTRRSSGSAWRPTSASTPSSSRHPSRWRRWRRSPRRRPGCVRVANMIEGGKTPLRTPAELHDLGFDLIVSPLTGLLAAVKQMQQAYGTLAREGTLRDDLELVTSFDDFGPLVDLDRHYATEAKYSGS